MCRWPGNTETSTLIRTSQWSHSTNELLDNRWSNLWPHHMIYNYMQIIPVPERNTCVQVCDEIHQIYIMQKIFNNVKWRSEHLVGGGGQVTVDLQTHLVCCGNKSQQCFIGWLQWLKLEDAFAAVRMLRAEMFNVLNQQIFQLKVQNCWKLKCQSWKVAENL